MQKPLVIGNGMIGSALAKLQERSAKVCHFASGVSNSSSCNPSEYEREKSLLRQKLLEIEEDVVFVYYSTCSIYDEKIKSMYKDHKLEMEDLVSRRKSFHIFRLPQVVGFSSNKFTLTNYFRDCIIEDRLINLQTRATRNLIDVEHVAIIADSIISSNNFTGQICNIANPINTSVVDIVTLLESALSKKSRCIHSNTGSSYSVDTSVALRHANLNGIEFNNSYARTLINKYYSRPSATK